MFHAKHLHVLYVFKITIGNSFQNRYDAAMEKRTDIVELSEKVHFDGTSYLLYGVVEHHGVSTSSGHYVAYVRAGCWWQYDDKAV